MEAALISQCSPRRSKQCRKLEVPTLKWPITSANFKDSSQFLGHEILDIAEAIVLALVASLLPAVDIRQRSGLDTGRTCTGQSGKLRVQAEGAATAANQERLYNASTVVEWLKAETGRKETKRSLLAALPSRVSSRIRAWKTTDPLNHPDAPAGPS
jgi:hypothetical protein